MLAKQISSAACIQQVKHGAAVRPRKAALLVVLTESLLSLTASKSSGWHPYQA